MCLLINGTLFDMKNDENRLDWEVVEKVAALGPKSQYGILYDALKQLVDEEPDREILALLAVQLQELSEAALRRSGYRIIAECGKTIN